MKFTSSCFSVSTMSVFTDFHLPHKYKRPLLAQRYTF